MKVKEKEEAEALAEQEMQQSKAMMWLIVCFWFWLLHILSYTSMNCAYHTLLICDGGWSYCAEEKRPKVKKPKVEFPVYEPYTEQAFVPVYDQGTSIEDIEDQMDDWLEDKKQQQKKKVSTDLC